MFRACLKERKNKRLSIQNIACTSDFFLSTCMVVFQPFWLDFFRTACNLHQNQVYNEVPQSRLYIYKSSRELISCPMYISHSRSFFHVIPTFKRNVSFLLIFFLSLFKPGNFVFYPQFCPRNHNNFFLKTIHSGERRKGNSSTSNIPLAHSSLPTGWFKCNQAFTIVLSWIKRQLKLTPIQDNIQKSNEK